VLCSLQDHLGIGRRDLDHHVLPGVENANSWRTRNEDLQCAIPLDVLMVPSSALTVASDGEHLMCGGFYLGEIVCLWNFEFITDYFGGMSLSPWSGNSGATFMGSTHSRTPSPRQPMIEDSVEEFLTASSGEGSSGLPSPRRRGTGALLTQVTTTP
jgi:hypothetical protein